MLGEGRGVASEHQCRLLCAILWRFVLPLYRKSSWSHQRGVTRRVEVSERNIFSDLAEATHLIFQYKDAQRTALRRGRNPSFNTPIQRSRVLDDSQRE